MICYGIFIDFTLSFILFFTKVSDMLRDHDYCHMFSNLCAQGLIYKEKRSSVQ